MDWCFQEAKNNNLKEFDWWGGFVIDEMKIEVRNGYYSLKAKYIKKIFILFKAKYFKAKYMLAFYLTFL